MSVMLTIVVFLDLSMDLFVLYGGLFVSSLLNEFAICFVGVGECVFCLLEDHVFYSRVCL